MDTINIRSWAMLPDEEFFGLTRVWGRPVCLRSAFVDLTSVANTQDEHRQHVLSKLGNDAVVSDAVAPQFAQRPRKGLAEVSRFVQRCHPFA